MNFALIIDPRIATPMSMSASVGSNPRERERERESAQRIWNLDPFTIAFVWFL